MGGIDIVDDYKICINFNVCYTKKDNGRIFKLDFTV